MKLRIPAYNVLLTLGLLTFLATPFISLFIYNIDLRLEIVSGPTFYLTEFISILILLVLIFWYFNSSAISKRMILSAVIGISAALLVMYGHLLLWFLNNANKFTDQAYERQKAFSRQQDRYIPLVTTIMDKAEKTNVRADIDKEYQGYLANENGRKPVYFIRLKNGKLQKLFQSGNIKYEDIDTHGEKTVRDILLGKAQPIQYPQYTCCGGDDIQWSQVPFFRLFVPERRYLKDFYSELEIILLTKDKNGSILGAMVHLHGD